MTIPVAVLLGFAGWTLAMLLLTIGWYRWSRIFTGRAAINEFEADAGRAAGWCVHGGNGRPRRAGMR